MTWTRIRGSPSRISGSGSGSDLKSNKSGSTFPAGEYNLTFAQLREENSKFIRKGREKRKEKMERKEKGEERKRKRKNERKITS